MKIFLYSNASAKQTENIDKYILKELAREKGNDHSRITYIPSKFEGSEDFYGEIRDHYLGLGVSELIFFTIDKPYNLEDLENILESDIIYLSGGNAFYFIQSLKSSGFDTHLKKFAQNHGVIIGVNAGGNVLTPNIIASTIPHDKLDRNNIRLTDLKGLSIIDFEFAPHYDKSEIFDSEIINYSKQTQNPIYLVPDGSAISLENGEINNIGDVYEAKSGIIQQVI